jgi:hypothetical protein
MTGSHKSPLSSEERFPLPPLGKRAFDHFRPMRFRQIAAVPETWLGDADALFLCRDRAGSQEDDVQGRQASKPTRFPKRSIDWTGSRDSCMICGDQRGWECST